MSETYVTIIAISLAWIAVSLFFISFYVKDMKNILYALTKNSKTFTEKYIESN